MAAFNPTGAMEDWRQRTLCVLRAQERVMQGMAAAARLELRFGQECMASRFGLFTGSWAEPGHASQQLSEDMDKLVAVISEINDELKTTFLEAGKLLTNGGAAGSVHKPAGVVQRTKVVVEDAGKVTVEDAGEEAGETAS